MASNRSDGGRRTLLGGDPQARLTVSEPAGPDFPCGAGEPGPSPACAAVGLAAHAACPVVVVRGRAIDPAELATLPVVVGADGSPTSASAVAFGFSAAAERKVPLVAVHTWSDLLAEPALAG